MKLNLDQVDFGDESVESIYEIHMTVECDDSDVELFCFTCSAKSVFCGDLVKPLVVQLGVNSERKDVMTSSKLTATPDGLRKYCVDLVEYFETLGWNVLRIKIETTPWHELAPQEHIAFKDGQYFESHLPVSIHTDGDLEVLNDISHYLNLHVSANAFKVHEGCRTVMTTFRSTGYTAEGFQAEVAAKCRVLRDYAFSVSEPIVEFAIYDSNRSHDDKWMHE